MNDITLGNKEDLLPITQKVEFDVKTKHEEISNEDTPKGFQEERPDGFTYVEEGYLRAKINKHYPVWSWIKGYGVQFIGVEWVVSDGVLQISDNGIVRQFYSSGAARIQFKKGQPHTADNVVDIDKNIASANTNAFKRAVNRLCNIADDVYHKRVLLTESQKDSLYVLAIDADVRSEIDHAISDGTINGSNYKGAIAKLERMIKENKNEGTME
jgi:hypothetical protein|tara:strand:- start:2396 stop:3034 length:639 start_codon:yes stop_codon:yes gene_type:complete